MIIVTGSSSGIGAAVARRLAGLGAGIVVNSAASVEAGQRIASELPDAVYVQGDIGDPATAVALVAAAEQRWGRLDGLLNNAGVTIEVPMPDIGAVTADHWEKVLRTNVIGTFLVSQAALPLLRQAGDGWIINITSLAGIRQTGSSLPYAVSKAAVNHLTTILAKHAQGGVRVNAVAPGLVATRGLKGGMSARLAWSWSRRCTASQRPRTSPTRAWLSSPLPTPPATRSWLTAA